MQPYINITINVLLKNSNDNPSLRISYESAKNKNTIDVIDTKNNKNTSLQNCLKLFGFTKEEIFKLTLFKKYGAASTLYLLKSEKTTVDVQKQMQNHINKLVRNFSEPEIPYEKTEYTTKIINKNECIINNPKFLIELLKKYRKYLAVIYDFDIDVSYDDTYVMLTCSTDQSIADDKTIEVEINESTKSDADGYERFFNDVALTRLDSETDKEIKKPVFWRIFSDVDNKLIMNAVKNRTIDFYKADDIIKITIVPNTKNDFTVTVEEMIDDAIDEAVMEYNIISIDSINPEFKKIFKNFNLSKIMKIQIPKDDVIAYIRQNYLTKVCYSKLKPEIIKQKNELIKKLTKNLYDNAAISNLTKKEEEILNLDDNIQSNNPNLEYYECYYKDKRISQKGKDYAMQNKPSILNLSDTLNLIETILL